MDESELIADEIRPTAGGSYVRVPDGGLMPEADWLALQAAKQPAAAEPSAPPPAVELPPENQAAPPPARRRSPEKEA